MGRALLFLTFGMVIVTSIIQMGVNNRVKMLTDRTIDYHSENQAKNITASLMDYAISEIRRDQGWKGTDDNGYYSQNLLGGSGGIKVYDIDDYLDPDIEVPPNSIPSWDIYTRLVWATATYNGYTAQTEVMLTQDSFSRFSYFTDKEPGNIYFFSGDVLKGPVHSNDRFNMAGTPVFYGKVTTTADDYFSYPYLYTDPQFLGGIVYNAAEIPLPRDEDLNELRSAAQNGGLQYDNPIDIELHSDGDITITEEVPGSGYGGGYGHHGGYGGHGGGTHDVEHNVNISDFNGVISSSEKVTINGKLKGQLTVHSENEIEITGDLTYATDPQDDENSEDILGLVSEGDIVVANNAERDHGYSDLEIQASLMALHKSFYVEDYNQGDPRGTLNLLGGIVQERRGAVGTFSNGHTSSGYDKNYEYDERLLRMHPPSFPRESFFNIYYWKDHTVVSN